MAAHTPPANPGPTPTPAPDPATRPMVDPAPPEEIRFLRASVADTCNLNCVYCPKASGMENFTPPELAGQRLSTDEYCANLGYLAASGVIEGISFTGGEPTHNRDLPALVAHARTLFRRVELTSNGRFLRRMLPALAPHLDVLKVSLDAADPALAHEIIRGQRMDVAHALDGIDAALAAGVTVGINLVAMRRNLDQLDAVIALAQQMRKRSGGTVYLSVLDLYYSDEQRQLWLEEFVPLDPLIATYRAAHPSGRSQDRKGCQIDWFDVDGVQVRFKSSYASTYRAGRCQTCPIYCQEGFYGLKHSVQGWVTPCPTAATAFGVHLPARLNPDEARARLAPLEAELLSTRRVEDSFAQFLTRRGLAPAALA
jgi:molybdenum cofactor biosynthesis enzyme MoaA